MTPDTSIESLTSSELSFVAEINSIEQKVDAPEAEASDLRWEQAEMVVAALDAGLTQQRLADNWKRPDGTPYSKQHVHYVAKTYQTFVHLSEQDRPRWNDAYNSDEVRKRSNTDRDVALLRYRGEEELAAAFKVVGAVQPLYRAMKFINEEAERLVYEPNDPVEVRAEIGLRCAEIEEACQQLQQIAARFPVVWDRRSQGLEINTEARKYLG